MSLIQITVVFVSLILVTVGKMKNLNSSFSKISFLSMETRYLKKEDCNVVRTFLCLYLTGVLVSNLCTSAVQLNSFSLPNI